MLICPSHFYLGETPEEINDAFLYNLYNGEDYLNHKLLFNDIDTDDYYEIVGIYSENKYTYGEYNICFTSFENVKYINQQQMKRFYEDCETCVADDDTSMFVVVDSYEDKAEVSNELRLLDYEIRDMTTVNTDSISLIIYIFLGISSIIILITFIIILVTNTKFLQYNEKNNIIYKAMGYDNKILLKINYVESILISIVSFVITAALVGIVYFILCKFFVADIKTGFNIQISELALLLSLIISMLLSILSTYIAIDNNKKSIIKGLEDSEL